MDRQLCTPVYMALLEEGYHLSFALGMNAISLPMQNEHTDGLIEAMGRVLGELR